MIGESLGSYQITRKLGEGGMGVVYAAEHKVLGRRAAIKVLLPEYSQNQDMVTRIFNEARAAALIEHPGMVDVYDFGHHTNGSAYIVMEFLDGESLANRLHRDNHLPIDLVAALGRQIASAVGAAHSKNIIHRDLKPDNVFLVPDDETAAGIRAKVLDFGIAKLAGDGKPGSMKTRTGMLMGTPYYMSPEQCRGAGAVDHRADIYSVGCMLYEMATGRPPFMAEGMGEIIAAQLYAQAAVPSQLQPSVPPWLDDIIMRTLAKNPDERPQSMEQLATELGGRPVRQRSNSAAIPTIVGSALNSPPPKMPTSPRVPTPAGMPIGPGAATLTPAPVRSTTLSRTASELLDEVPARSRKGLWLAFAGIGVVGAAAIIFLATRGKGGQGKDKPVAVAPAPDKPDKPDKPVDKPPDKPDKPVDKPPDKPVAPAPITLKVTSEPAGAEVYRAADGIKVGITPLSMTQPGTTGLAVFIVKLGGFKDEKVELDAAKDGEASVNLVKLASSHPPTVHGKPPAGKPPADKPPTDKPPDKPPTKKPPNDTPLDPFGGK